jgi:hypothetical protein
VWGAIIVGVVSWLLHLLLGDKRRDQREDREPEYR